MVEEDMRPFGAAYQGSLQTEYCVDGIDPWTSCVHEKFWAHYDLRAVRPCQIDQALLVVLNLRPVHSARFILCYYAVLNQFAHQTFGGGNRRVVVGACCDDFARQGGD